MQITVRVSLAIALIIAAPLLVAPAARAETQQQRVHRMSHAVMPFDMSKTIHVFRMTQSGGVERVEVRDPADQEQIPLIRRHLRHEASRFQRGDYSDPARLHGEHMPGLDILRDNAQGISVSYAEIPNGAQITFETSDLRLLTAIHRWFGAQLSEHGADARAE